jgi:hypothetical protein
MGVASLLDQSKLEIEMRVKEANEIHIHKKDQN